MQWLLFALAILKGQMPRARSACKLHSSVRKSIHQHTKRIDVQYEVGEMAWLNSQHVALKAVGTRKLLPKWRGPFKILAKPSPVNYVLDTPARYRIHTTLHVSMLHRAYDSGAGVQRPPIIMVEGEEEFEIQAILSHIPARKTRTDTGTRYLVQWKGYGPAYNSWEPERTLKRSAPEMLSDYWHKQLSLKEVLTLGWPLVIKFALPPREEFYLFGIYFKPGQNCAAVPVTFGKVLVQDCTIYDIEAHHCFQKV